MGRKHLPVSIHETLHSTVEVNWLEYENNLCCPFCGSNRWLYRRQESNKCKLELECTACQKKTALTCRVPQYSFRYRPGIACPNPNCKELGPDGTTKGWVYFYAIKDSCSRCRYCGTNFIDSDLPYSWLGRQRTGCATPFRFEDNIWNLQQFFANSSKKTLNFSTIRPDWFKQEVKRYLYELLKTKVYKANVTFGIILYNLKDFSVAALESGIQLQRRESITRKSVLAFLDSCKGNKPDTLRHKLSYLRNFFEWLELDTQQLVRRRDFPKQRSYETPDWLDEAVRVAIQQHLHKIPTPIACQYLVQEYTAARPGDICLMKFDCLIEENGKWYVQFYQEKVERWHRLIATREIRKVIEQQQQWIRQTLGDDYQYLFCHFWGVFSHTYPKFLNMKPLPEPPGVNRRHNQMTKIINLLIENEDIRDANGQRPDFKGKITRSSRLQEVRVRHGIEAAQLYADHKSSITTFQHYASPTQEQVAKVDLPFQEMLLNPNNRFLPWQNLPESLLQNPKVHELDMEIGPRLVVYGHCALDPRVKCPHNLYPKCYDCGSFRPSTSKLPFYERQYVGEKQRMEEAEIAGAELAFEEAKSTVEAMERWLPQLRRVANG